MGRLRVSRSQQTPPSSIRDPNSPLKISPRLLRVMISARAVPNSRSSGLVSRFTIKPTLAQSLLEWNLAWHCPNKRRTARRTVTPPLRPPMLRRRTSRRTKLGYVLGKLTSVTIAIVLLSRPRTDEGIPAKELIT